MVCLGLNEASTISIQFCNAYVILLTLAFARLMCTQKRDGRGHILSVIMY
uniref:Uncharacterized protein n=1 Tax=Picea sitchensis TaxID=3332 RepID=A9NL47_PICSI|nr:unknown [Picea sitchensis]